MPWTARRMLECYKVTVVGSRMLRPKTDETDQNGYWNSSALYDIQSDRKWLCIKNSATCIFPDIASRNSGTQSVSPLLYFMIANDRRALVELTVVRIPLAVSHCHLPFKRLNVLTVLCSGIWFASLTLASPRNAIVIHQYGRFTH